MAFGGLVVAGFLLAAWPVCSSFAPCCPRYMRDTPNRGMSLQQSITAQAHVVRHRPASMQPLPLATHALPLLKHTTFWSGSTLLAHNVLPPLRRLFLPVSPSRVSSYLESKHEQFQPLSIRCWMAHICSQATASCVALSILLPSTDSKRRVLGLGTLLSTIGGGLLLGSHALINKDAFSEQVLYFVGTKIVRAAALATGVALLFPSYCTLCFALTLMLSSVDLITFANQPGRLLALSSLVTVGVTESFCMAYRIAYVGLFLVIPFLPSSHEDLGHSMVAAVVGAPLIAFLMTS